MITAIVKLQGCTTRAGRRAFVRKDDACHGIAHGRVRRYRVTGDTWTAIRRAVAGYDTTGKRTMGYSNVGPATVESFTQNDARVTGTSVIPIAERPGLAASLQACTGALEVTVLEEAAQAPAPQEWRASAQPITPPPVNRRVGPPRRA